MNPHLTFHHFGLAVRRPDEARRLVAALGLTFCGCDAGLIFFAITLPKNKDIFTSLK